MLIDRQTLLEQFSHVDSWEDRYRLIIQLARQLPTLTPEQRAQAVEIKGCENRVWLGYQNQQGKLHFYADSEGRIVKGLLVIILIEIAQLTPAEINNTDLNAIFDQLKISQQLSQSRLTGLKTIIDKIKQICSDVEL